MLKAALDALARKYWYSGAKVAERGRIISQAISFDVANAMTLHRQAAEQANAARRSAIDEAIGDFAGAIGEVVEAIKETSASLSTTSSALNQVADDTPAQRMASASSASAETTQRMSATVAATEALSGIDQRDRPAIDPRGLSMAQSAVADAERDPGGHPLAQQRRRAHWLGGRRHLGDRGADEICWRSTPPSRRRAAGETGKGFAVVAG